MVGATQDLWNMGVIIFEVIQDELPFGKIPIDKQYHDNKKLARFEFNEKVLITHEIKDLVEKLLVIDPSKRITWEDFILHPFIEDSDDGFE